MKKLFLIIVIIILLLGIPVGVVVVVRPTSFPLKATTPVTVEDVMVSGLTFSSATITWTTSVPAIGEINYGLTPPVTFSQKEKAAVTNHLVILTELKEGAKYYFVIKIGDQLFDQNGQPYTFATKAKTAPTPLPTSPSDEEALYQAMEVYDPLYDLNHDGVVNTLDLELFRRRTP